MKAYTSAFRIRFLSLLQYRTAAMAGVLTQFFWGFMILSVFFAFNRGNPGAMTMSTREMASYIWLQQAFLAFVMLWFRDTDLLKDIVSGGIAYDLCRPLDMYWSWYVRLAAQRLAASILRCVPILAVAVFLPEPYRLFPSASLGASFLFALAITAGLFVQVAISMFIYMTTCFTMNAYGTMIFMATIGEFCSGMVVPIPIMPDWLKSVMMALPFRLVSDLPFRIYSGHIGMEEGLRGVVSQLLWFCVLVIAGKALMGIITRRAVIQGG